MINTLANLLFLNDKAHWRAGESLIPNTGETSLEKHLGHTLRHSTSNRHGTEPDLGTAEVPMSRGDKHYRGPQSQPAVQCCTHKMNPALLDVILCALISS